MEALGHLTIFSVKLYTLAGFRRFKVFIANQDQ